MEKTAQTGFTLLELMITISVAAVLLAVGVPSFKETILNNRRAAATNEIIAVINNARSEAIKRNTKVVFCPSTSGTGCTSGANWEDGSITFVDDDLDDTVETSDGNASWDAGEQVLFAGSPLEGMTVRSTFTSVTYRPNGRMQTSAGGNEAEFIVCDDRGVADASIVLIWISGRPQASDTTLSNAAASTCTPS